MRLKKSSILVVLLMFIVGMVVVAGCGGETTTTTAAQTTTTAGGGETTTTAGTGTTSGEKIAVKVAVIAPMTGQLAKYGIDSFNAVSMAVEEFNASGALPNVTVSVEQGDDVADPAKAAILAEKFVNDKSIVAIVGPLNSSSGQAALPILEKAGLPLVTPAMTNVDLAKQGYTVFFRTCPKDDDQGYAIAQVVQREVKGTKVFMIDDKSTYGQGLAEQTEAELKALGITDIKRVQITPDDKDFSAIITTCKSFGADAFVACIPSPAQYAAIAKQMAAQGYKIQLIGSDGSKDKAEFIDNAGGATEGAYVLSLGPLLETSSEAAAQEFVKKYDERGWEISLFSGQSYEAATVVLKSIEAAYKADGKVDRAGVIAAIREVNYQGLTGIPISFTPEGNLTAKGIFLVQVEGTDFVQVRAID